MACGTPVISSNVSSMPEILGDAGVLIAPNNPQALGQSLLDLINDPMERHQLSLKGLERASAFTWERTAEKTIAVYRHVFGLG